MFTNILQLQIVDKSILTLLIFHIYFESKTKKTWTKASLGQKPPNNEK